MLIVTSHLFEERQPRELLGLSQCDTRYKVFSLKFLYQCVTDGYLLAAYCDGKRVLNIGQNYVNKPLTKFGVSW